MPTARGLFHWAGSISLTDLPRPSLLGTMYTLLIRDEQGNMRVVHDWHRGDEPHLYGDADCQALAAKIRGAYPNTTAGLELCYYYTGDDRRGMSNTRTTDAFDALPRFGRFLFSKEAAEPDAETPRVALERTAPPARSKAAVDAEVAAAQQAVKASGPPLRCPCGWSGGLSDAADYDAESVYCIDWTCAACGAEHVLAGGGDLQLPVSAES
jgi:hypothetical protein